MTAQAPRDYLDSLIEKTDDESLCSAFEELKVLYNRRLYHNLTLKLVELFGREDLQNEELIGLFNNVIKYIDTRMNFLTLAQLAVKTVPQFETNEERIEFLNEVRVKISKYADTEDNDASVFLAAHVAFYKNEAKQFDEVKEMLSKFDEIIDGTFRLESSVYSAIYRAKAAYHKARDHLQEFYRDALLYLSYTNTKELPKEQQVAVAYDLSIAALVGENAYHFQDLLTHPVVEALRETEYVWLAEFLEVFSKGSMAGYEEIERKYAKQISEHPALVENKEQMKQKITILSLMELIFDCQGVDRNITFELVAERTALDVDMVEHLLMKTLSLGLVKGKINQVDRTVRVTWVQPRQLDLDHVGKMRERLSEWSKHVHETLVYMEQETPDLFT